MMSLDAMGKAGANASGSDEGSDDEEVFKDVDRVREEKKRAETAERKQQLEQINSKYSGSKPYDPLKREPKYANAENSPMWELASLAYHCHPTVCLWAEKLLSGNLIDYAGDPLLDFGLANFLDRVSYKSPKTAEKAEKYRKRMAQYEKPINEYNFREGEAPETKREEEQFLYKYMQMRAPVAKREVKKTEGDESENEDPELEAFAHAAMEKEMKKMAGGLGADESDAGEEIEYSDAESEQEGGSAAGDSEEGGFFSGEDLQEVELS